MIILQISIKYIYLGYHVLKKCALVKSVQLLRRLRQYYIYTDIPLLSSLYREASNRVVSDLIKKPAANTVVSFLDTDFVNSVLKAVARSERANGKLRFFGSDAWADNQEAMEGVEDVAVGSLTIKLDSDDVEVHTHTHTHTHTYLAIL